MTREKLDLQFKRIYDELLTLGELVEEATKASVKALQKRDTDLARRVIESDKQVNERRAAIEDKTLILIATQQPAARDLRIAASILEVNSELERMGDYAKGIARICINLGTQRLVKPLIDLPKMAELATSMLHRALLAFVNTDGETALAILPEDDEVDALYKKINRDLFEFVMTDAELFERANHLLWAAHNLERLADRVTNICERTLFIATGDHTELDMPQEKIRELFNES